MSETTLQQAAELTELLEKQNKLYALQGTMLKGQIGMMKQLQDVFSQLNFKDKSDELDGFNDIIKEAAEEMEGFSKTSQSSMTKLSDSMRKSQKETEKMGGIIDKVVKKGPMIASLVLAFDGMTEGIKFSVNAMKSLGSIAGTVVGSLTNLAFSIITLPFKMLQGLINMTDGGGGGGLRQALEDIRKEFGDLKTGASEAIIDISKNMKGPLAETGLSSYRIFGNLAERLATVAEYAKNMGNAFDLVRESFVQDSERVGAYIKGLGLAEEGQKALADTAVRTGQSLQEIGREITTYAYQMGEAFGINGKSISGDVGKMMDDFENFGGLGVKTLANISVYARKLGVEVKALQGVIGKFDNFEDAAESVAHLSQAFGLQLDTLQLINAQDPAERIEMLRKSFFAAGRSIENMNRQERALLETQTGLDQKTASLVFSMESQGQSYADIQKQSDATSKKQLSQAEAMEKLSGSIERLVKSGGGMSGGFFDRFIQGFSKGIRKSGEFRELMFSLRKSLMVVHRAGIEVGRAFVDAFPGVREMIKGLADFFDPGKFRKAMRGTVDAFKQFFRGDLDLKGFQAALKANFSDFFDPDSAAGQKFQSGVKKFFAKVRTLFIQGVEIGMGALKKGADFLVALIRNPTEALAAASSASNSVGGFFMTEVVQPLLKLWNGDARKQLFESLGTLFETLFQFVLRKVTDLAIKYREPIMKAFMAIFVAPAMISGITRGLIGGVGAALTAGLSGALKKGITALRKGQSSASSAADGLSGGSSAGTTAIAGGRQGNMISRSIDGLGNVLESARNLNMAGAAKLIPIGALFAVFGLAIIGSLVGLISIVKSANISAMDVVKTILVMTSASLIATELGLLVKGMQILGASGALIKAAAKGFAMIAATGVAVIGGLKLMIWGTEGITASQVATTATIVGSSALIILGLAGVFAVATGTGMLAVATSGVAAVGFIAIGLTAVAAAEMATLSVDEFKDLSIGSLASTGASVAAVSFIILGLSAILATLTGSGILGAMAPLGLLGGAAILGVIAGSAEIANNARDGFASINTGEMKATGEKIASVAMIIGGLAIVGGSLLVAGVSAGLTRVADWFGVGGDSITVLIGNMKSTTDGILEAARGLNISETDLKSIESIKKVIEVVVDFAGIYATMAAAGAAGVVEAASTGANLVTNLAALRMSVSMLPNQIGDLVRSLKTVVTDVSPDDLTKIGLVGEVLKSVGDFVKSIIGAATSFPQTGEGALKRNLDKITVFLRQLGPVIGDIFTSISGSIIQTISGAGFNATKFSAATKSFSEILTSLSTFVSSMVEASKTGGGEGAAQAVGAYIGTTIGSILTAISDPAMQDQFTTLIDTIGGLGTTLNPAKLKGITRFGEAITSISTAMASIAQNSEQINTASMTRVQDSVSAMIESIQNINTSIQELRGINLNTELKGLVSRLGLASREQLKIEHGNLNITINLKVQVDAAELEKVLLGRDSNQFLTKKGANGAE